MLLDLSEVVEASGFDSVWVGDSLFSKPRYEPIALLAAISQRTSRVKLGTACMVSSTRNPLYLALEWATLDQISGGRTIFGTGMGNPEEGVRREFEALGLDYVRRGAVFEEGLAVLRELWTTGSVTFKGRFFDYEDVGFYSGTEMGPLMPLQPPPPIWVVSNPRLKGDAPADVMQRRLEAATRRILRYGDGWMTCCRAQHPEELVDQLDWLRRSADQLRGRLRPARHLLPGDDEHRRLGGRGARRLRRLHLEVLPGAVAGDGPLELGAGRDAGPDRGLDRARSPRRASTTSSAASARSTSSTRSGASRARCCHGSHASRKG